MQRDGEPRKYCLRALFTDTTRSLFPLIGTDKSTYLLALLSRRAQ
jgi:hypothetical protein